MKSSDFFMHVTDVDATMQQANMIDMLNFFRWYFSQCYLFANEWMIYLLFIGAISVAHYYDPMHVYIDF